MLMRAAGVQVCGLQRCVVHSREPGWLGLIEMEGGGRVKVCGIVLVSRAGRL